MSWRQTFLVLALDLGYIAVQVHHAWALICDELLGSWEARAAYVKAQLSNRFSLCKSSAAEKTWYKTWYAAANNQRICLSYQIYPRSGYFWFQTKRTNVLSCQIDKDRSSVALSSQLQFVFRSRYAVVAIDYAIATLRDWVEANPRIV